MVDVSVCACVCVCVVCQTARFLCAASGYFLLLYFIAFVVSVALAQQKQKTFQ